MAGQRNDEDDRPRRRRRDENDDDDRPRRRRSSKEMGFLDRTFADTNIGLLILFAVCLFPIAFILSLLESIVGEDEGALQKAHTCMGISLFAGVMQGIAFLNSGIIK